ncbi:MAG: lipoate-protein ligase [Candidatus Angelobacter sp.]|jgi:lipoyl(octanoyl) transferase|nr:lipoate-protein ligase [Candidatus Angelobacter sp.]
MPHLQVLQLGTIDYATALKLQETLVELRKQGRIADTLLLLEHTPVITLGRNANAKNILDSPESLAERGVEVFEIKRGGDVTFHGPGQLVGYPICDLRGFTSKVGAVEFVRRLEEVLIRACTEFGIDTKRVPGMTGVWTNPDEGSEKKIAAIGVHISRGITSHGFALNVTPDLESFKMIVPCGIADKAVTSMEQEWGGIENKTLGRKLEMEAVSHAITRQFGQVFGTQILWLESLESLLKSSATESEPANQDTPNREPEELRRMREELDLARRDDIHWA